MEMNTRLQVEHPVTERITGVDLVAWQLRVAAGERLPLAQDQIASFGHAIEARLYAEDPERGFLPSTGTLAHLRLPRPNEAVRVDTGVTAGDRITPFYDPMLAKIVAWGPDRAAALRRLRAALGAVEVVGPATNIGFLERVAAHPAFAAGAVTTRFVDAFAPALLAPPPAPDRRALATASLWLLCRQREQALAAAVVSPDPHSPWHRVDGWRLNDRGHQTLRLRVADAAVAIDAEADGAGWRLRIDDAVMAGSAARGRRPARGRARRRAVARDRRRAGRSAARAHALGPPSPPAGRSAGDRRGRGRGGRRRERADAGPDRPPAGRRRR